MVFRLSTLYNDFIKFELYCIIVLHSEPLYLYGYKTSVNHALAVKHATVSIH
jgi:hypothetical protein